MEREVPGGDKVTKSSIRRYHNYPVPILERLSSELFSILKSRDSTGLEHFLIREGLTEALVIGVKLGANR